MTHFWVVEVDRRILAVQTSSQSHKFMQVAMYECFYNKTPVDIKNLLFTRFKTIVNKSFVQHIQFLRTRMT